MKQGVQIQSSKSWIVFVSTFPPRQCGIGTYTHDLTVAIDELHSQLESRIVAMNSEEIIHHRYSSKVMFRINEPRLEDYQRVAVNLNKLKRVALVSIQHEFGIFGGDYGAHLLPFLEMLQKPAVLTFHTILPSPNQQLLNVVQKLTSLAKGVIVMTQRSADILKQDYSVPEDKIHIVPHGIHSSPYTDGLAIKKILQLFNRFVLSTFGFLSRSKGIEYVLEALPQLVQRIPNLIYLIIGATHPTVLRNEGEEYRRSLMRKVYELGLENNVRFYNRYLPLRELLQFLQATDTYIATSLNPDHAVSGTLCYALGAGRPIISTAFAQAKEYVTDEVGMLVDFKNPQAYAEAITALAQDNELRLQKGKNAYFRTRSMIWPNVAIAYMRVFSQYLSGLNLTEKMLPSIKLTHLSRLTDSFGILQFANLTEPNPEFGYTVDDNARALIAVDLYFERTGKRSVLRLIETYLNFLQYSAQPNLEDALAGKPSPRFFENYINSDRAFDTGRNNSENLEDANARALSALAKTATTIGLPFALKKKALDLYRQGVSTVNNFVSPRAAAFFIQGLVYILSRSQDAKLSDLLRIHAERLLALYNQNRDADWEWFEDKLTYSNSVLPEALLLTYKLFRESKYWEAGRNTLDFLITQTFSDNMYMPIGQGGWYRKGAKREYFDQQSEDTAAMVHTLKVMYTISKDEKYKRLMHKAFSWFLGDNILGQVVYERATGGCYDGVGKNYINLNQGAESTISYLIARLSL